MYFVISPNLQADLFLFYARFLRVESTVYILGQWALSSCFLLCWSDLNWDVWVEQYALYTWFLLRPAQEKLNIKFSFSEKATKIPRGFDIYLVNQT